MSAWDAAPHGRPLLVGHRGDPSSAPENTLAAFAAALAAGVDAVECDVRLSADGVPVVIHDPTLDRTTDGRGPVAAQTAAALTGLAAAGPRAGDGAAGPGVPLLRDVLDLCRGRALVMVELKPAWDEAPGLSRTVAAVAEAAGMAGQVLLLAFDHRHLEAAALPHAAGVALVAEPVADPAALLLRTGAGALGPHHRLVDGSLVASVHGAGGRLVVWTVDDAAQARHLRRLGVDAVVTNRPGALRSAFLGA